MRVAGRFLPPTAGQITALAGASPQPATHVAVVTEVGDPVPLDERLDALREGLPGVDVAPWEGLPVDAVVDEGDETVRVAGADVVAVPGPSPADVRRDPMRHWAALPPAMRPRYVRRLRLFGPESTGKSTAAEALAAHFATVWVPEMSRPLYEAAGYRFTYDDVVRVVAAQVEAEEAAAREATRVLVCDTDVLTTHLYSLHYFGRSPALAAVLARLRRYDATLLFNLDVPWEADPVRDSPEARATLYRVFEAALRERGVAFTVVGGTGEARIAAAIVAAEAALGIAGGDVAGADAVS